jgi:programmed cell death protein 5
MKPGITLYLPRPRVPRGSSDKQLSAILGPGARERLHRIELVKPERARGVSDLLINMQRAGRIRAKVRFPTFVGRR